MRLLLATLIITLFAWTSGATYWYVCEQKGLCSEVRQELDKLASISRQHLAEIELANQSNVQSSLVPSFFSKKTKRNVIVPSILPTLLVHSVEYKNEFSLSEKETLSISLDDLMSDYAPEPTPTKIVAEPVILAVEEDPCEEEAESIFAESPKPTIVKARPVKTIEEPIMVFAEEEPCEEEVESIVVESPKPVVLEEKVKLASLEEAAPSIKIVQAVNTPKEYVIKKPSNLTVAKKVSPKVKAEITPRPIKAAVAETSAKKVSKKPLNKTNRSNKAEGFYAVVGIYGNIDKAKERLSNLKQKGVKGVLLPHVAGLNKVAIFLDTNAETSAKKLADIRERVYSKSNLFYYNPN